jgi:hypothetical protein
LRLTRKGAGIKPGNTLERGIGKKVSQKRGIIEWNSIYCKELHIPTTRKRDQKEGSAFLGKEGSPRPTSLTTARTRPLAAYSVLIPDKPIAIGPRWGRLRYLPMVSVVA